MRLVFAVSLVSACVASCGPMNRDGLPHDTYVPDTAEGADSDLDTSTTDSTEPADTGADACALAARPLVELDRQLASDLDTTGSYPLAVPMEAGSGVWTLPDGGQLLWWPAAIGCRDTGISGMLAGLTDCPDDHERAVRFLVVDGVSVRSVTSWPSSASLGGVVSTPDHGPVLLGATDRGAVAVTLAVERDGVVLQPLADLSHPLRVDAPQGGSYGAAVQVPAVPIAGGRILWGETIQDLDPLTPASALIRLREAGDVEGTPPERWPSRSFRLGDALMVLTHDAGVPHTVPWEPGWATASWEDGTLVPAGVIGRASGLRARSGAVGGTPSTGDLLRAGSEGWIAVESATDTGGQPIASVLVARDASGVERWSTPTLFKGPVSRLVDHPDGGWVVVGDDRRARVRSDDTLRVARVHADGAVAWRRPLPVAHVYQDVWVNPEGVLAVWQWEALPGVFEPSEVVHHVQQVELPRSSCPGDLGLP